MPDLEAVSARYDAMAREYVEYIDDPSHREPAADAMIAAFADSVFGRVLDAGCGPGQWTSYLHERGLDAEGIDASPAQLDTARRRYPHLTFTAGDVRALPFDHASFDGVLVNFSLIHTEPTEVPATLDEFARVLRLGGVLLLGGFADLMLTDGALEYDHRVCPAFRWAPTSLVAAIRDAGFAESATLTLRPPPWGRSAGVYVMATKQSA